MTAALTQQKVHESWEAFSERFRVERLPEAVKVGMRIGFYGGLFYAVDALTRSARDVASIDAELQAYDKELKALIDRSL